MRTFGFLCFLLNFTIGFGQDVITVKQEIRENASYREEMRMQSATDVTIYRNSDPWKKILDSVSTVDSSYFIGITKTGNQNALGNILVALIYETMYLSKKAFDIPDDLVIHAHWDGSINHFDSLQTNEMSLTDQIKFRSAFRLVSKHLYSPEFEIQEGDTAQVERVFSFPAGQSGTTEAVCTYSYIFTQKKDDIAYFDVIIKGNAEALALDNFQLNFSGYGTAQFDLKHN